MRREALTLVFAMIAGTVLMAACEKKPPQPKTATAPAVPPSGTIPAPPPVLAASPSERKDGVPPVQGEVDTKDAAQKRDYQNR